MPPLQFHINQNFLLNPQAWGEADLSNVVNLLDNVISIFYSNLDTNLISGRPVLVAHSSLHKPPRDYPEMIRFNGTSFIFLNTQDRLWSQYAYQFSHELCHYVVDTPFPPKCDKFGWFEEAICELASIFTLKRMALAWKHSPPYPNWTGYADSLNAYADNIINAGKESLTMPFDQWLSLNLETLYQNRIDRSLNKIVAVQLLPIFNTYPKIWRAIHYLSSVNVNIEMSFEDYVFEWRKSLPNSLSDVFLHLADVLVKKTGN